jgi:hypothetical protein
VPLVPVANIVSRCYELFVLYVDGATRTVQDCDVL